MKNALSAALIAVSGAVLGLAANQLSPRGISLITPPAQTIGAEEYISLEKAKEAWGKSSATFIDAREPADFEAGHIGNALNLPALSFEQHFGMIAPMLTPESRIVVYCDGKECDLSRHLAANLRQLGFTNSLILSNGWTSWRQAGFPVVHGNR